MALIRPISISKIVYIYIYIRVYRSNLPLEFKRQTDPRERRSTKSMTMSVYSVYSHLYGRSLFSNGPGESARLFIYWPTLPLYISSLATPISTSIYHPIKSQLYRDTRHSRLTHKKSMDFLFYIVMSSSQTDNYTQGVNRPSKHLSLTVKDPQKILIANRKKKYIYMWTRYINSK